MADYLGNKFVFFSIIISLLSCFSGALEKTTTQLEIPNILVTQDLFVFENHIKDSILVFKKFQDTSPANGKTDPKPLLRFQKDGYIFCTNKNLKTGALHLNFAPWQRSGDTLSVVWTGSYTGGFCFNYDYKYLIEPSLPDEIRLRKVLGIEKEFDSELFNMPPNVGLGC
ncbi:MAG: hypothetical protein MRY83_21455 [Flavobacteriales bacterium]|nr:hypothetical protein [Flavobacteriales bacterium]